MKINIPTSWDQITVEQFIELNTMNVDEFDSVTSIQLERLAIITETSSDDEIWEELDVRELNRYVKESLFLTKNPSTNYKKELFSGEYVAKDFIALTLGEFIDLEYFLSEGNILNLPKISAILYRKKRIGDWGETIIEPYSVINLKEREKIFFDLMITDIFGLLTAYIEFKTDFLKKYEALFEPEYDFDEESEEELDEVSSFEAEQEKIAEEKVKKWSWEKLLFMIAGNDMLKVDQATEMGLVYAFNLLSMKQELNINS